MMRFFFFVFRYFLCLVKQECYSFLLSVQLFVWWDFFRNLRQVVLVGGGTIGAIWNDNDMIWHDC